MKNEYTTEYRASQGENVPQTAKWRWTLAGLFGIVSGLVLIAATIMLRIANFFLFDTHHIELNVTPKV